MSNSVITSADQGSPASHGKIAGPKTGGLFNAIDFAFFPRSFSARHVRRYGSLFGANSFGGHVLFTAEPDQIKRVFAADSDTFVKSADFSLVPFFGESSVLITVGDQHKRQRKLLSPPLSGPRLRAMANAMHEVAQRHVATLTAGKQLRALDLTNDYTLDVIVRTVFGLVGEREQAEAKANLRGYTENFDVLSFFVPALQKRWYPPWARFVAAREASRAWLLALIATRRKSHTPREDVLSLLLEARYDDGSAITDEEIHDQLITLLLAGHETTAISLANTLDNLLRRPAMLARVHDEIAQSDGTPEALARLPFMAATIDEALRIQPIVTDVLRVPTTDFELTRGVTVPRGKMIVVLIEALHFDERIYPEPHSYRPDRFLGRKFLPHEFAPFGGGVRRCLGAAFSDMESRIFLGTLLGRVALETTRPKIDPRVRRNLTMAPKHGVPIKILGSRQRAKQ